MGKKIKIILGILAIFMIVGNIGYGESLTEEKEEIYMDKIDNNAESDGDINMSGDIGVEVGKGDIVGIKGNNITITGNNGNGVHTISQEIFSEPPSTIIIEGNGEVKITAGTTGVYFSESSGTISGKNIDITGIDYNGIRLDKSIDSKGDISGKVINIVGGTNGVYFENSTEKTSIQGGDITITGKKYNGIYLDGNGSLYLKGRNTYIKGGTNGIKLWNNGLNQGKITIKSDVINLSGETEDGILVDGKGNIVEIEGKNTIISGYRNGIGALYGGKAEINSINTIILGKEYSIYADSENNNVKSEIILSENGSHEIYGNIKSSRNSSIKIGGKGNKISSSSDNKPLIVTAEDGGEIDISLVDGILTGIVDDGRAAGANTNGGTISLNLNNGTWKTQGKSFVTSIDLRNNGNIIFTEEGTSVDIKNLSGDGNGTFGMTVNAINKSEGNMLYVQESNGGIYNVALQNSNLEDIKIGEKIRFATIGNNAKTNNLGFKVADIKERGIRNINFKVEKEEFDKNDSENEIYNGGQTPNDKKPGNDYVVGNYQDGENWYLTRNSSGNINDGGITVIEMAKSNYANAVYMDNLNKRLGDMSFADGESGLWVRMRNDKVGEDNHYKLHNYMTQIGYDKSYSMENGIEHRGIAFEYGKGDMKYKELKGNTDTDKYILTLYKTKVRDNKVYTDYTLRGGAISNDFTVYGRETGAKVTGKYKNMVLGAGTEVGKRYELDKNWYIEPQAQLQYTYINSTDYTTNQMTKVDLNEIHSLIGRAGIKLGHDSYKGNKKDNTVYVKADINHEFLGEQNVKAKDETGRLDKTYKNNETWVEIGIGASKKITPDLNVYADVEKQLGSNKDNKNWQVNVGFRYKF